MIFKRRKRKEGGYFPPNTSTTTSTFSVFTENPEDLGPCPWGRSASTVEEFLVASDIRNLWIATNGRQPPTHWSMILPHSLIEDMCRKIMDGEK